MNSMSSPKPHGLKAFLVNVPFLDSTFMLKRKRTSYNERVPMKTNINLLFGAITFGKNGLYLKLYYFSKYHLSGLPLRFFTYSFFIAVYI